jgi:hypothetical protein
MNQTKFISKKSIYIIKLKLKTKYMESFLNKNNDDNKNNSNIKVDKHSKYQYSNNKNINKKNFITSSTSYNYIFSDLEDVIKNYSKNFLVNNQTIEKIRNVNQNDKDKINQNSNSEILNTIKNIILNRKLKSMKILSMFNENNFEKFINDLRIKSKINTENLLQFEGKIINKIQINSQFDQNIINFLFKINKNYYEKFFKLKNIIYFLKRKNLKEVKKLQIEFLNQKDFTGTKILEAMKKMIPILKELRLLENKINEKFEKFTERENSLSINSQKIKQYEKELLISSEKYSVSLKNFSIINDEINKLTCKKNILIKEISNLDKCLRIIRKNENLKNPKKILNKLSYFHPFPLTQKNKRILFLNENDLLEKNLNFEFFNISEKNENLYMENYDLKQIIKKEIVLKKIREKNENKNFDNNMNLNDCGFFPTNKENEIGLKFLKEILTYKFVQIKIKKLKEKENFIFNLNLSIEMLSMEYNNSEKILGNLNGLIEINKQIEINLIDLYIKKRIKCTKYKSLIDKINLL